MRKALELADPASCWNKADDGELVFILLERDRSAPLAIEVWCLERIRQGKNTKGDPQIVEAMRCAAEMRARSGFAGGMDLLAEHEWLLAENKRLKNEDLRKRIAELEPVPKRIYKQMASRLRDIASRIGPARLRSDIYQDILALANQCELWAGGANPEKPLPGGG